MLRPKAPETGELGEPLESEFELVQILVCLPGTEAIEALLVDGDEIFVGLARRPMTFHAAAFRLAMRARASALMSAMLRSLMPDARPSSISRCMLAIFSARI